MSVAAVSEPERRHSRVSRAPGLMPFVHEVLPPTDGICSVCGSADRVWRFGETPIRRTGRYTLVVGEALCQPCLDMCVDEAVAEEDNDAASL